MADPLSLFTAGSKVLGSSGALGQKGDSIGPALSRATLRDNTFVTGSFGIDGGSAAVAGATARGVPGGSVLQYAALAAVALIAAALIVRSK